MIASPSTLKWKRITVVGVPRHTKPNGAAKPFFVGCAQIRKPYKKPAKPFQNWLRGLLYAWWSGSGQNNEHHAAGLTQSRWRQRQQNKRLVPEKGVAPNCPAFADNRMQDEICLESRKASLAINDSAK